MYNLHMQQSTQQEILNHIQKSPGITAQQLSIEINVTQANIHYHISNMLQEGLISASPAQPDYHRVGRPALGYVVSPQNKRDNYSGFLAGILTIHPDLLSQDNIKLLAREMVSDFSRPVGTAFSIIANSVMGFLSDRVYQPHWEAAPFGPRIYFENCPYQAILPGNPKLCQLDVMILEQLTGATVKGFQTRIQKSNKHNRCIFQIE